MNHPQTSGNIYSNRGAGGTVGAPSQGWDDIDPGDGERLMRRSGVRWPGEKIWSNQPACQQWRYDEHWVLKLRISCFCISCFCVPPPPRHQALAAVLVAYAAAAPRIALASPSPCAGHDARGLNPLGSDCPFDPGPGPHSRRRPPSPIPTTAPLPTSGT